MPKCKLYAALAIVVFLFLFGSFKVAIGSRSAENPSRFVAMSQVPSETHTVLDGSDMDMFRGGYGISTGDGSTLTLERNLWTNLTSLSIEESSVNRSHGKRMLVRHGGMVFIGTTRSDPANSTFSFHLMVYHEREDAMEGPVLVHRFPSAIMGYMDMEIGDSDLYFMMSTVTGRDENNGAYIKIIPLDEWIHASSLNATRLDPSGGITDGIDVVAMKEGAVAFWIEDDTGKSFRSLLLDGSWTSPLMVREEVETMAPLSVEMEGTEYIAFLYANENREFVNCTLSPDGGLGFGITIPVGETGEGVSTITSTTDGERIHVAALNSVDREIYHFMSIDVVSWMDGGVVGSYDAGPHPDSVHIAHYRSQVYLAFTSGDHLETLTSFDRGYTFPEREILTGAESSSPSLGSRKGYITYFDHGSGSARLMRSTPLFSGTMESVSITAPGIRSWEGVGMDLEGMVHGSTVSFRIEDNDGGVLFPSSGWFAISGEQSGDLAGSHMDHVLLFDEEWALADTEVDSLRISIMIDRAPDVQPVIERIIIDHSTKLPMVEGFDDPDHIKDISNMTLESGDLKLGFNKPKGYAVIGPFSREESWGDVLRLEIDSANGDYIVGCSVLSDDMEEVAGFGSSDGKQLGTDDEFMFFRWKGAHLTALPLSISTIYLRLDISIRDPTADPRIESLVMDHSEPPLLKDADPGSVEIIRGNTTWITMEVDDLEDSEELMSVDIMSRPVGTTSWSEHDHMEGALWENGEWKAFFSPPTNASTGPYEFAGTVTDTTGNSSQLILFPFRIDVKNSIPLPPQVLISPEIIRTGDDVHVRIARNGSDRETAMDDLEYRISSRRNGEEHEMNISFRNGGAVIPGNTILKGDIWQLSVFTIDGSDSSMAEEVSFEVVNTPPVPDSPPSSVEMEEDSILELRGMVNDLFRDRDGDVLELMVEEQEGIDVYIGDGDLVITPEENFNGPTGFTVRANDGEYGTRVHVPVTVESVNDRPTIQVRENLTIMQDGVLHIPVRAEDPSDNDVVDVSSDLESVIPGVVAGENLLVYPNGSMDLRTDNRMVGSHGISFSVSDGELVSRKNVTVTIENRNDPPSRPEIVISPDKRMVLGETEFTLKGESDDPDIEWGDSLEYEWNSSLQGDLGSGNEISTELMPGNHEITLTVRDSGGLSASNMVMVSVKEDPEEKEPVMRTGTLLTILSVAGALLGAVIGTIIFLMAKKQRERSDDKMVKKEEKQEKDDDPKRENGDVDERSNKGGD